MGVKFEDNSDKVMDAFDKKMKKALTVIGLAAVGYAQDITPVDTGRLANSINYATKQNEGKSFTYKDNNGKTYHEKRGHGAEKDSVYIGTNVEYAPYIELGTTRSKAFHMLKNAIVENADEYERLANEIFNGKT